MCCGIAASLAGDGASAVVDAGDEDEAITRSVVGCCGGFELKFLCNKISILVDIISGFIKLRKRFIEPSGESSTEAVME